MIEPKYFNTRTLKKKVQLWPTLAVPGGWRHTAFGGIRANHFQGESHGEAVKKVHRTKVDSIGETAFEQCMLLTMLEAIKNPDMVFVELGAGWGAQTVFVTTAIREQVVDTRAKRVFTLAVEAEPGHYGFLYEAFRGNYIEGIPVFGAIGSENGWAKFLAPKPPAEHYGQSVHPSGKMQIPQFSLDYLMDTFGIEHVDLIHMDLQRAEPNAIRGSLGHIGEIDYMLICPHETAHVQVIRDLLAPTHEYIIGFGPRSGYHEVGGFPLPVYHPQDGCMVFERRGL